MRKIFTKRNIIIFIISLVVSTLFWASFFVSIQGSKDGCSYTFLEIIWGCKTVYIVDSNFGRSGLATISSVFQSAHIDSMGFNVPGFLSALFILLSSIVLMLDVFLVKNDKTRRLLLSIATMLLISAGILGSTILLGAKKSMYLEIKHNNDFSPFVHFDEKTIDEFFYSMNMGYPVRTIIWIIFIFISALASFILALPSKKQIIDIIEK